MSGIFHRRPAPALVVALLALFVALGSGALAATSGTGGTITVCVSKQGGTLYRAKRCKNHDASLSWNRQGLPGARGPAGANGAVQGLVARRIGSADMSYATSSHPQTILTESLPAGSFIVNAKSVVDEQHPGGAATLMYVTCDLSDGKVKDEARVFLEDSDLFSTAEGTTTLPLTIATSSTARSTVRLTCWPYQTYGGQTFTASQTAISAVQTTHNTTS